MIYTHTFKIRSLQDLFKPQPAKPCTEMKTRLLSTARAAIYLGVSPWTVRRLVWSGELPAHRGRRMRFDVKDLDAWIEKQKERVSA